MKTDVRVSIIQPGIKHTVSLQSGNFSRQFALGEHNELKAGKLNTCHCVMFPPPPKKLLIQQRRWKFTSLRKLR